MLRLFPKVIARGTLVGFAVWTALPFLVMARTAFTGSGVLIGVGSARPSLDNFRAVLQDPANNFVHSLALSFVLSSLVCLLALLLGVPAAYSLARMKGRLGRLIGAWILGARFLPPVIPAVSLFFAFRFLGLLNGPIPLILTDLIIGLPFVIWVTRSYILDLSSNLDDMAALDRITRLRRLWNVIIPSLRLPLAAVAAMTWIQIWNEYFFGLIFGTATRPLPVLIASWNSYQGVLWGPACAAGLLAYLPAIVLLLLSLRLLLRGFTFGLKLQSGSPSG